MMNTEEKLMLSARPGKLTLIRTGVFLKCYQQSLFSLVHAVYPVSFSEDNRTYFRSRMHCNNKGQSKKSLSVSEYYPTECKLDPTCICCLAENFVFQ